MKIAHVEAEKNLKNAAKENQISSLYRARNLQKYKLWSR